MIDEYTKLPYIGKKRAKKLQSHGIGLEEIAQMDELSLKKHIPRISSSKLKVIIATARDIVGRMNQLEQELNIDKHKAKVLALEGYDISKVANANKKEIAKLLNVPAEQAFDIIFKASLKTGVRRAEVKVAKEEISGASVLSKEGFVNGFGSGWKTIKIEEKRKFKALPFIIVILLVVSGIGASVLLINPGITIDGNLADWNDVGGLSYGNLTYKYRQVGTTFYFLVRDYNLFSTDESFYIAIDDGKGGYWMNGIRAHYVAEFYGWNSTLRGAHLWRYVSGGHLWNFTTTSGMTYAVGKYGIEGSLSHVPSNSRVIFMEKIKNRVVAETAPLKVTGGSAQVVETNIHQIITNGTPVFRINVTSPNYFVLDSISFNVEGANITSGYVMVNNDRFDLDASSTPVAKVHSNVRNMVVVLYANFTGMPTDVVSIKATLHSGNMHFSYIYEMSKMYLFKAPDNVRIDGAFGDWSSQDIHRDIVGDVYDSNIDLVDYASTGKMEDIYMRVRGEFMGGTDIPIVREWHFKDSDHDGVPDSVDPYPHDFNNDGIPDNKSLIMYHGEEVPDVDGDGIADYPYGPDMWLNTTIPSTFPKPYAGKHVSIYIGPAPPVKPKNGNDTAEVYFEGSGGAHLYWVPFPVKYKIEITGRDGVFNSTLYRYDSGKWYSMGPVKSAAAGYHSIELATGLNLKNSRMWITVFNWNHQHDMPSVVRGTRGTETNVFYFHADSSGNPGNMDWNVYSSKKTVELEIPSNSKYAQESVIWEYQNAITEKYYVQSAKVTFYVSDYSLWYNEYLNMSLVAVDSSGSYNLVAYYNDTDVYNTITDTGKYTYTLSNIVGDCVEKGEYIGVIFTYGSSSKWNSGDYIDIDYNSSSPYNSNLQITTNTTIDVKSVWTENSAYDVENTFSKGDYIYIFANVTDPLGAAHISSATVSVNDPLGNAVLNGNTMNEYDSGTGYKIYNFELQLNGIVYSSGQYAFTGKYPVSVTATDAEGNTATNDGYAFYLPSDVLFRWSKYHFVPTGPYKSWFFHKLSNYGNGDEIINFEFNASLLPNYDVMLYIDKDENHEITSYDTLLGVYVPGSGWKDVTHDFDGNGIPDLILEKGATKWVMIQENISLSNIGDEEYFMMNASSSTGHVAYSPHPEDSVFDVSIARAIEMKTLYLKGADGSPDYLKPMQSWDNTQKTYAINPPPGQTASVTWTMAAPFSIDFNLASDIYVKIYISHGPAAPNVNLTLALDDGTYVGSVEFKADGDQNGAWYTEPISPQIPEIARGRALEITVTVDKVATIYYNSSSYNSRIEMNTTSYIWVRSVNTYNATTNQLQTTFHAGDTVLINASVKEPFGSGDILLVSATVTTPNGTNTNIVMSMSWDRDWVVFFTGEYHIPQNARVGWYKITVTAVESNLVSNSSVMYFNLSWSVNITPGQNASTGNVIYYNHTIWNNGSGYDEISFSVWSNRTVNVTLYLYVNGKLELMAYSNTGTGWSWVNSSFDSDSDGNPDLWLAPGSEARIIMRVNAASSPNTQINTTLNITDLMSLSGTASDITTSVPEFSYGLMVIFAIPLLLWRRKRHK